MDSDTKTKRKYNSEFRKKLNDNIKRIKNKKTLVSIFKIVNSDIGSNYSENKSGIYFNMNLLKDSTIEDIKKIVDNYNVETTSEESSDKMIYKSYSENEIDIYNSIGPRLSNQEKNILRKFKNMNE